MFTRGARFGFQLLVVLCAAICAAPGRAAAQIGSGAYQNREMHFELKAAQKWTRGSEGFVEHINSLQDDKNPWRTWTVEMVWTRTGSEKPELPVVRLETTPLDMTGMRYDDIQRAFDARAKPELATVLAQPLAAMVSRLPPDQIVLDRAKARMYEVNMLLDDGTPVTRLFVGFVGRSGTAHLAFVCPTDKLGMYMPEFQSFVDTFRWEAAWGYSEPGVGGANADWEANRSKAAVEALRAEERASAKASSRTTVRTSFGLRYIGFGTGGVSVLAIIAWVIYRAVSGDD